MTKTTLIKHINSIIEKFGSFGIGEVESDCSPCVNAMGSIVGLAENFSINEATIEVYDGASTSSDSIRSYEMPYKEMPVTTLKTIYKLAKQYKKIQIDSITQE